MKHHVSAEHVLIPAYVIALEWVPVRGRGKKVENGRQNSQCMNE